ncbi:MAG: archaellin/type IV pilin N-terminal domain-containing protein [Methanobacteriota archaeon]
MKANRKTLNAWNDRAEVGIGTMIVFIATVLVAAVAASVLIDTSSKLQERSARTGNEATAQVASNVAVLAIIGKRDSSTATNISNLTIVVTLAPGAQNVDLGQLKVRINTGAEIKTFGHLDGVPTATQFNVTEQRDADNSFSSSTPVMSPGDLVEVNVDLGLAGLGLAPRKPMQVTLYPEVGSPVRADFTSPPSYGTDTKLALR